MTPIKALILLSCYHTGCVDTEWMQRKIKLNTKSNKYSNLTLIEVKKEAAQMKTERLLKDGLDNDGHKSLILTIPRGFSLLDEMLQFSEFGFRAYEDRLMRMKDVATWSVVKKKIGK